jgi:hypothetical protein
MMGFGRNAAGGAPDIKAALMRRMRGQAMKYMTLMESSVIIYMTPSNNPNKEVR